MINLEEILETLQEELPQELKDQDLYQRTLFEKYCLRNEQHKDTRELLWKKYNQGEALTGTKGLRKQLAAFDMEYFGRAYLPHYFIRESPKFHGELDAIWSNGVLKSLNPYTHAEKISRMDGCRRAIEAPRGHAKSTTFTFKDTLHAAIYQYKHYVIILSDSSDQADGFLGDIKTELEDNLLIKEDFGKLEGKVWKANVILLSSGVKIESIGSGKKIRGRRHKQWRPDLLVMDDVENDENVNTPDQRKKLASWFYKAVSKAGDTYTDIVYIGTLLHYDSLLAKVANNPQYKTVKYRGVISFASNQSLWNAWEKIFTNLFNDNRLEEAKAFFEMNKEEMLEGTEVLWEQKLSYYDLMVVKLSEGDASFNSEIQNDPIDPDNCTFNEEWFDFYNEETINFRTSEFMFFAANDPSLGKNKKSDTSAIIVIALNIRTGYIYILVASIERRKPDVIIDDAIAINRRLKIDYGKGVQVFGVEDVQFQSFFKDVMAKKSAEIGEYLPIEAVKSSTNKDLRIQSLQPFVKNGYIKFNKKHQSLINQMKEYPMGKNDDAPDCLEMVVKIALNFKGSFKVEYKSIETKTLRFNDGAY